MNATHIVPGDLVLLASGSAVPADCRVNEGTIDVDQAQLTGESLLNLFMHFMHTYIYVQISVIICRDCMHRWSHCILHYSAISFIVLSCSSSF